MNIKEEMRQDRLLEAHLEAVEELKMRDEEYALGKHYDELQRIYDELQAICKKLDDYGHEFTPTSLIGIM
jgi:regulator of replication initiation timing